jgi:hypothetical protein
LTNLDEILAALPPDRFTAIKARSRALMGEIIHVYSIGDTEWWAGIAPEYVAIAYADAYGIFANSLSEVKELTVDEMETLQYVDEDVKTTFRARLDYLIDTGVDLPCFFASSEQ